MRRHSRKRVLLLAFLLLVVGVSTTAIGWGLQHSKSGDFNVASAADDADHTITFVNHTGREIWIGSVVNDDGSAPLTGLPHLNDGQSAVIKIPEHSGAKHWRGRFLAREGCTGDSGRTFHCAVGDCGLYIDHCTTGAKPASLAEFNFDPSDKGAPWYDVSYVDAVSVPITITPDGVKAPQPGECAEAGCLVDLLSACPPENLTEDPENPTKENDTKENDKDTGKDKPLVCVNPNRDATTPYSDAIKQKCATAYTWSKQDAEAGNQVMRNCTKCSGLTVTFGGADEAPAPKPTASATGSPETSNPPGATNPPPAAATGKKGVGLNDVNGASEALAASGVSWYYNWTSSTGKVTKPEGAEYVPMIWGPGSVTDAELSSAKKEGKELLTFQEPDSPSQSNLTVEQAVDLWPKLEETGLRLGAPAVASGADTPGGWLDRFMQQAEKKHLRVDFIPVHWFGGDFGPDATKQLNSYLEAVHNRYHKPVWLTQYALTDYSKGQPRYPSPQQQTDFIKSSTKMLDGLDYVERYAWFTLSTETSPTGLYDGTTANASGRAYHDAD